MTTFTDADSAYRNVIEGPGREMSTAFEAARLVNEIDLNGLDITCAAILRLQSFLKSQREIKLSLGKIYAAPAADFFVETVCFYLKVVLGKLEPSLSIESEKSLVRKKGSMRPDISIWQDDQLIAAIECKTQLGWNRDGWLEDFEKREGRLKNLFPAAELFLLVMTGSNWSGFDQEDHRRGRQLFMILNDICVDLHRILSQFS